MVWRVSIVEGSSMVQNQKLRRSTSAGRMSHPKPYPERSMMLSRRSISIATHPMPPSDMAILRFGYFTAHPDHNHSAHAVSDNWPNSVAPSDSPGLPSGWSAIPDDATCRLMTVSVSEQARMMGSQ